MERRKVRCLLSCLLLAGSTSAEATSLQREAWALLSGSLPVAKPLLRAPPHCLAAPVSSGPGRKAPLLLSAPTCPTSLGGALPILTTLSTLHQIISSPSWAMASAACQALGWWMEETPPTAAFSLHHTWLTQRIATVVTEERKAWFSCNNNSLFSPLFSVISQEVRAKLTAKVTKFSL